MTWRFSPEVVDAFDDAGIPVPGGLQSFILKVLSMRIVKEGEIEFTSMGLGLKIQKRKYTFAVDLLEEAPVSTNGALREG